VTGVGQRAHVLPSSGIRLELLVATADVRQGEIRTQILQLLRGVVKVNIGEASGTDLSEGGLISSLRDLVQQHDVLGNGSLGRGSSGREKSLGSQVLECSSTEKGHCEWKVWHKV